MSKSVSGKYVLALPIAAALLLGGQPASAQDVGLIVINVDLRNARILNNVARNLSIDISNVPITVQVPINVAVQVCDVDVNVLTTAFQRGGATCTAQQTNLVFNQIVQRVVNLQDRF